MPRPTDPIALGTFLAAQENAWQTLHTAIFGNMEALAGAPTSYTAKASGQVPSANNVDYNTQGGPAVYLDPADLVVPDRQTQLRIRAVVIPNNTAAPTPTFTFGLVAPVISGTINQWQLNIAGGFVAGTAQAAFTNPTVSAVTKVDSAVFDAAVLTAGLYVIGLVISGGAIDAGASIEVIASLQARNVEV